MKFLALLLAFCLTANAWAGDYDLLNCADAQFRQQSSDFFQLCQNGSRTSSILLLKSPGFRIFTDEVLFRDGKKYTASFVEEYDCNALTRRYLTYSPFWLPLITAEFYYESKERMERKILYFNPNVDAFYGKLCELVSKPI